MFGNYNGGCGRWIFRNATCAGSPSPSPPAATSPSAGLSRA